MFIRDPHSNLVRVFRWIVFLLAAGYFIRHVWFTANYDAPGGPFKYLTFWALTLSTFASAAMLSISEGASRRTFSLLVAMTAVINAVVVMMYWRLWFTDPSLVNNNGPIAWYDEYYFHLLGPVLQWIDAIFVYGAVRRFLPGLLGGMALVPAYVGWVELFVAPMNDRPVGSQASGMPYPFMNNMSFDERMGFYTTTLISVVVIYVVFWCLSWVARKLFS